MVWRVPEVTPTEPAGLLDERQALDAQLRCQRESLQENCAGLDHEQLSIRPVATSLISLLGIVRHITDVERWWFRMNAAGERLDFRYDPNLDDSDFRDLDSVSAEEVFTTYWAECTAADSAVAGLSLDDTFINDKRQARLDLRWAYLHMIEEYARHNGQADIIRELIDGRSHR
jgi:uncharacterized damage-inducible protein DinB